MQEIPYPFQRARAWRIKWTAWVQPTDNRERLVDWSKLEGGNSNEQRDERECNRGEMMGVEKQEDAQWNLAF
jgi:hypothetical protein